MMSGLVAFICNKYGRYLGSDEYTDLRIHSFTDISLDRPWASMNWSL